ncbi:hypothetical protein C8Q76DRAFT_455439 [Earliella scabrosa]|nr:hypothetical protein C8Q76DRAFT_455439 [Earliella scabrosa]
MSRVTLGGHDDPRLPALNQDVLEHIFEHGPLDKTLSHAAVVCRTWRLPAQAALYRELFYFPLDNRPRDLLLARTMRTSPHLRRHVRRLSLITLWNHSPTPELCDWIQYLPPQCLREFQWTWIRGHILPAVIASPAIRTVSSIHLRGRFYTADKLQPVLELPLLHTLSLELTGHEQGDLLPVASSRLKHLQIFISVEYGPIFDKLLAVVGAQLESLQLVRKICFDPDNDWDLVEAVETHCHRLTSLSIRAPFTAVHSIPIVDRFIRRYRSLEYLCCSGGTYTAGMFRELPPNLRVLELSLDGMSFPHYPALVQLLSEVRLGERHLHILVVTTTGDSSCFDAIANECRASGVTFRQKVDSFCAG